jgi:hypothetical protein
MKMAQLLGALLACAPLAFAAGAPAPPEPGDSSAAPSTKAARAVDGVAAVSSGKGHGSKPGPSEPSVAPRPGAVDPRHTASQVTHGPADRFRSLPSPQARGRLASQSGHPVGSAQIATDNRVVQGVRNARLGQAKLPDSRFATRAVTSVNTVARISTPGVPRAAGPARIGGPAIARTTNNAGVDGAQLHRKR